MMMSKEQTRRLQISVGKQRAILAVALRLLAWWRLYTPWVNSYNSNNTTNNNFLAYRYQTV